MWTRLLLLLALVLSAPLQAQPLVPQPTDSEPLRELLSARGHGMGGAWRALGLTAESANGNPAALALFPAYRIELTGAWDWGAKDAYGMVAISDAVTSPLAVGITYQLASLDQGPYRRTVHMSTLGMGLPLMQGLLLGGSVRYAAIRGDRNANPITGDLGVLARLGTLHVGVSVNNLVETGSPELTRYYSAHAALLAGMLAAAADVRADFTTRGQTTLTWHGGLEYLLGQALPLRVGYTYDGFTGASRLGLGAGFLTQSLSVDLAYRHDFGGRNGQLVVLTFKLQVR